MKHTIFNFIKSNNEALHAMRMKELLDKELSAVMSKELDERVKAHATAKRVRRANRNFKIKANGGIAR